MNDEKNVDQRVTPRTCPSELPHDRHDWWPGDMDPTKTPPPYVCAGWPVPVPDSNPYKSFSGRSRLAAAPEPGEYDDGNGMTVGPEWLQKCPQCGAGDLVRVGIDNPPEYSCGHTPMRHLTCDRYDSESADPYRPHVNCGLSAIVKPHPQHNWTKWAEAQPHDVFCPGIELSGPRQQREDDWHRPSPEEIRAAGVPHIVRVTEQQTENRALPVRWADRAMFQAEPIDTESGPQVHLLWMTPDPLGAIAAACKMYKGEVIRDLSTVTNEERMHYLEEVRKTKLKAPFEFVKFHFLIEGVTRAFTHQMVRQRTAVYAQESLRFAVVTGEGQELPLSLPPSLSGLPENHPARMAWRTTTDEIQAGYRSLVEDYGIPAEDARGLLPHNVLTRLHYSTDLRALLDHAGNRLCTQAQFEWRLVFAKIVESIREKSHGMMRADADGMRLVYQSDRLSDLFKPVCYQTGKCEFKANFDRACSIRERVDANAEIGRPSSEWDQWHNAEGGSGQPSIAPIKPGEWLLDHKAARRPE